MDGMAIRARPLRKTVTAIVLILGAKILRLQQHMYGTLKVVAKKVISKYYRSHTTCDIHCASQ